MNACEEKAGFRPASDAGIAIGPILFIIAILGILAAAIAAGSGSFTATTTSESNSTKAAALIDIGQNMRTGWDRLIGEQSLAVDAIGLNVLDTSSSTSLFAPTGGGIAPPSTTMALTATGISWLFPTVVVPGIGTSTGSRLAMLQVASGVCDQINAKANGLPTPSQQAIGDLTGTPLLSPTATVWGFDGVMTGCVNNSGTPAGYLFYQVLGIQ